MNDLIYDLKSIINNSDLNDDLKQIILVFSCVSLAVGITDWLCKNKDVVNRWCNEMKIKFYLEKNNINGVL